MSSENDILIETLALYAMDLLEPEERTAIDKQLRHSAEARQELALVMSDLAAFAVTAEMHSPPALTRQRLLKQIARERKPSSFNPVTRPNQHTTQRTDRNEPTAFASYAAQASAYAAQGSPAPQQTTRRIAPEEDDAGHSGFVTAIPYIGWALAAGLGFATFVQYNERISAENNMRVAQNEMVRSEADSAEARAILDTLTNPTAQRVTLTKDSAPPAPTGKVTYMPDKGMLTFIASNMEPLQPYKTYELWLIPAVGDPIPAGTFKPDDRGNASLMLPELP
jgi:hypothetical protein